MLNSRATRHGDAAEKSRTASIHIIGTDPVLQGRENRLDPCLLIGEHITRRTGVPKPVTQPCLGEIAFETRLGDGRGRSEVAELRQSSSLTTGTSPWHVARTCQCRDSSQSETLVARKALTRRPLLPVWAVMWASIGCEPSELSEGRRHWERFFDASETPSRNIEHQQQIEAAGACARLLRTALLVDESQQCSIRQLFKFIGHQIQKGNPEFSCDCSRSNLTTLTTSMPHHR